jgi:hypothetical protein
VSGFDVDRNALSWIAKLLSAGSDDLEAIGRSVPDVPDAGPVTGDLAAVLSALLEAGGEVALGLEAASTAVSESSTAYSASDEATASRFTSTGRGME